MNKKNKIKNILLVVILLLISTVLQAQEERKHIRRGTDLFGQENFLEAEIEYRKALDKKPDSYEGRFNVSATQFRQEKYDEAINDLLGLINRTDDPEKLHQIYHNLGNSYLRMMNSDGPITADQYLDMSIDAYKNALKNNPLDDETRYNLIAAMKLKQQREDNEDQQQEQQEQEQDQQQDEQDQQQDQQQPQEQQDINRDNAERILQALEQEEKDLHEKLNQQKKAQPVRIEKNW